ncbi:MAG: superoxide dismutase, partial [Flavisolibacter sp.]
MTPLTRRNFLANTGKAGLGVYLGSSLLSACSPGAKIGSGASKFNTGFQQTPLPYSYNALN